MMCEWFDRGYKKFDKEISFLAHGVATLALGSQPRQGLAKV